MISLPPLVNSQLTRLTEDTTDVLVEVTSDKDEETVVRVMEMWLKQMMHLGVGTWEVGPKCLAVERGRVATADGRVEVYPAKDE